ncbi:MAG: ATP-binding cassette domain-containing protein [Deltaproteobacteria bacterium]|nr:ATP-binding cassette domain-containing protein [Deltaproteobacteria bacterium]
MIEARGLARTFQTRTGPVEAVRGVDFHVAAGEIVGFLGPNGAGKTTTQRMLSTLLSPTAGTAIVAGCDLRKDPVGVRRQIGYVAQGGATNPMATVDEELVTQARLYGMTRHAAEARAKVLRTELDLPDLGQRQAGKLSGGQRRRLDIALGLMHTPTLVFLDEPSTGLDPHSRANLWTHIRGLRDRERATVFLTTHYLDEADALCDRILIIDHGTIVAHGTPAELKRRISGEVVTLTIEGDGEKARDLVAAQAGVRDAQLAGNVVRATVDHGDAAALALMRLLDGADILVAALSVAHPTLDDVFLTMTGRSLRDADAPGGN